MKVSAWVNLRWSGYVEVEVPDGCPESVVIAALDAEIQDLDGDDVIAAAEYEHSWTNAPTWPPEPNALPEPPEGRWVEADGHRWAFAGYLLIREDAPRPRALQESWTWRETEGDKIRAVLQQAADAPAVKVPHEYDANLAPVLSGGDATEIDLAGGCSVIRREGEVIALAMAFRQGRSDRKTCNYQGVPNE